MITASASDNNADFNECVFKMLPPVLFLILLEPDADYFILQRGIERVPEAPGFKE